MGRRYLQEKETLEKKLSLLGIEFDLSPFWEKLVTLAEALEEKAEELHLTAVRGVSRRLLGPFWESLLLAVHLPPLSPIADLGTGAGIPGLVVKIARPELTIHLIEAYRPRVRFMENFIEKIGLKGAFAHQCHIGKEDCRLKVPLALARGYGEVGKFVRHAAQLFGVEKAFYLWRYQIEPWKDQPLPLKLVERRPFPEGIELLVWERLPA